MRALVIHHVLDAEGLKAALSRSQELLQTGQLTFPEGLKPQVQAFANDFSIAACVWEGPSMDVIKERVEAAVGQFCRNEYFEAQVYEM